MIKKLFLLLTLLTGALFAQGNVSNNCHGVFNGKALYYPCIPPPSTNFALSDPTVAPYSPGVVGDVALGGNLNYEGVIYTCAGTIGTACTYAPSQASFPNQNDQTINGNNSGGSGPPTALTPTQTRAILNAGNGNSFTYAATPAATGDATFNVGSGVVAVSKIAGVAPGTLFSQSPSSSTEPQAIPSGTIAPYSYLNPNVSSPVGTPQTNVNGTIIRVSDFGILNDGVDHTTLMNNLMVNAPAGSLIQFPCSKSGNYVFAGQLNFKANHVYRGDMGRSTTGCPLLSNYGGGTGSGAAFNFLGAGTIRLEDLTMIDNNSSNPPEAVAMFGDVTGSVGDNIGAINVKIQGYATKTLVYSIAAEGQSWHKYEFALSGGGANYIWYTADSDTLSICSTCTGGSNTDIRFNPGQVSDVTASAGAGHCAYAFAGTSGTKDISIENAYVAMPGDISGTANGSAICILSAIGSNISVDNVRAEGSAYFATTAANFTGLHLTFNTLASITGQLNFLSASAGTTLVGLYELGNTTSVGSSIAGLVNSFISEPFSVTVTSQLNSIIHSTNNTNTFEISSLLQLLTNLVSQPTCATAFRGAFYSSQSVLPTTLLFCAQDQSGAYAWRSLLNNLALVPVTFTPGTNITSVTCTSATCNLDSGSVSVVGGALASTGTFATVSYTAITTAPRVCQVTMNGGATFLGLGHGTPSTTSFTLTSAISVAATTFALDYICKP